MQRLVMAIHHHREADSQAAYPREALTKLFWRGSRPGLGGAAAGGVGATLTASPEPALFATGFLIDSSVADFATTSSILSVCLTCGVGLDAFGSLTTATALTLTSGCFLAAFFAAEDFTTDGLDADDLEAGDFAAATLPAGLLFFSTCRFFVAVFRADVLATLKSLCGKCPRAGSFTRISECNAKLFHNFQRQLKVVPRHHKPTSGISCHSTTLASEIHSRFRVSSASYLESGYLA